MYLSPLLMSSNNVSIAVDKSTRCSNKISNFFWQAFLCASVASVLVASSSMWYTLSAKIESLSTPQAGLSVLIVALLLEETVLYFSKK